MSGRNPHPRKVSSELRLGVLADYYAAQSDDKPKAARLVEAFLKMMEAGYWTEGDRIPSELQLAESLPVGLATVQSALRKLADEGLVLRKRKAGTFVADPTKAGFEAFYFRFLSKDGHKQLPLTDANLSVDRILSQGYWSDFLGHCKSYVRVERAINVGGQFQMFSQLYLPGSKFGALLDIPVSELRNVTFRYVFRDRFGVTLTKSDRRISFSQISLEHASLLNCSYGLPAIQYDVLQYMLRDEPVFFMRTIIPQNRTVLQVASTE